MTSYIWSIHLNSWSISSLWHSVLPFNYSSMCWLPFAKMQAALSASKSCESIWGIVNNEGILIINSWWSYHQQHWINTSQFIPFLRTLSSKEEWEELKELKNIESILFRHENNSWIEVIENLLCVRKSTNCNLRYLQTAS